MPDRAGATKDVGFGGFSGSHTDSQFTPWSSRGRPGVATRAAVQPGGQRQTAPCL